MTPSITMRLFGRSMFSHNASCTLIGTERGTSHAPVRAGTPARSVRAGGPGTRPPDGTVADPRPVPPGHPSAGEGRTGPSSRSRANAVAPSPMRASSTVTVGPSTRQGEAAAEPDRVDVDTAGLHHDVAGPDLGQQGPQPSQRGAPAPRGPGRPATPRRPRPAARRRTRSPAGGRAATRRSGPPPRRPARRAARRRRARPAAPRRVRTAPDRRSRPPRTGRRRR